MNEESSEETRYTELTDTVGTEEEMEDQGALGREMLQEIGRCEGGEEGVQGRLRGGGELECMETDESTSKENQGGPRKEGKRFRILHSNPGMLRIPLKEFNGIKRKFQLRDEDMEEGGTRFTLIKDREETRGGRLCRD